MTESIFDKDSGRLTVIISTRPPRKMWAPPGWPPSKPISPARNKGRFVGGNGRCLKAYIEGYPGEPWKSVWRGSWYPACDQPMAEFPNDGSRLARYFRKHNAFAAYHTIQASEDRWAKIVSEVVQAAAHRVEGTRGKNKGFFSLKTEAT